MKNFSNTKAVLIFILLLAAFFRLLGINWDQNQHLHPDERFLTMVEGAIKIPQSFADYLNPKISPMNPYNAGYNFFVYGTFPLNLTKIAGGITGYNDYGNIHFVGRFLSALFDLGVVFLIFKIGRKIFNEKAGLLAAFLYSIMVLPIQLSHFFAVDTFLNFFLVLSFYFLVQIIFPPQPKIKYIALNTFGLAISFGLALACKISALYFLPIIGLGLLRQNYKKIIGEGIIFFLLVAAVFRLTSPSAFATGNFLNWQVNPQFLDNLRELKSFNDPNSWYPPAVQWKKTTPLVFPLKNLVLWGLGLPLGIATIVSILFCTNDLLNKIRSKNTLMLNTLILLWIFGLFFYQGIQFCKTMRYFLPLYPFLALLAGNFLLKAKEYLAKKLPRYLLFAIGYLLFAAILVYPVSFISVYTHPITRITASEWIYKNVPAGSVLANEYWDDPLPLLLPEQPPVPYRGEMLSLYDSESSQKWEKITEQLQKTNYLILSSNRLYGSIPKAAEHYPQTTKYYRLLFDGSLGFKKVAEFSSPPCFPPWGKPLFCFNESSAEEAFTVYDHPKVMIFQKQNQNTLPAAIFQLP